MVLMFIPMRICVLAGIMPRATAQASPGVSARAGSDSDRSPTTIRADNRMDILFITNPFRDARAPLDGDGRCRGLDVSWVTFYSAAARTLRCGNVISQRNRSARASLHRAGG